MKGRIFSHFTPQLARSFLLLALSSGNYAFDNQGFNTTQAMDYFWRQFGVKGKTGAYTLETYFLSLLNSLPFTGFLLGIYIGSVISLRYGRRMTVFVMSLYAICTAIINITALSKGQILAGRVLNYVYVGMELSVIPMFQAEIMPAEIRGFAVSSYQFTLSVGGLIINSVCRGTSTIKSNWSWRIPYTLFLIVPTIIASLIWFCPESPRWYAMKGRDEEALESLRKFKGKSTDFDAEAELARLKEALEQEKLQGSYSELFKGTNRKRTLIAFGSNFFLQSTGQAFSSAYGAIFIKSLGTVNPFNMTVINAVIGLVGVGVAMYLTDKIGRRKLMMFGAAIQFVALLVLGASGVKQPVTNSRKILAVSMQSVFGAAFAIGWAPQNYVITAEVGTQRLRDKTVRLASFVNVFTQFVVTFTIPYLLNAGYANLQSKLGFVYAPFALLAFIFAYFFIPNMMGKSLEDIDTLFEAGIPARKFATTDVNSLRRSQRSSSFDELEKDKPTREDAEENSENIVQVPVLPAGATN